MEPFEAGWKRSEIETAIIQGDIECLRVIPILVSMDPPECRWAEAICLRLSGHEDNTVRGNAILSFGHLARTCGVLNLPSVVPVVLAALQDKSAFVRGHANDAFDDIEHYLSCNLKNYILS